MGVVLRCDFHSGGVIDGKYTVERELGEGAFGKVYQVKNGEGETFALKLLKLWEVPGEIRRQLVNRFDMEYETGQISSHYLVRSIDHGFVEGNPYIVMEYCSGGDLLQYVKSPEVDLVKVARHILYGLKDLHGCGKVHRDLKPENVLLRVDGTAVLTDFGISGDRNKRMTEMNWLGKPTQIFGTYAYMPPEQVNPKKGDVTVLPTTDIFSFGCMMFQLLTGDLPFGTLYDENGLVAYLKNAREGNWNRQRLMAMENGKLFSSAIEGCLIPDFKKRLQAVDEVLHLLPQQLISSYKPNPAAGAQPQMHVVHGVLLRVMQGEEYGKVYKLEELLPDGRRIITMGRNSGEVINTLPVREEQSCYISRKHCTLELDAVTGNWYIRDGQWDRLTPGGWKGSLNGTFINSTEVPEDGLLISPGDIISVGDAKLRVEGY